MSDAPIFCFVRNDLRKKLKETENFSFFRNTMFGSELTKKLFMLVLL